VEPDSGQTVKALLVHPGTQHSFRLATQLEKHGCLGRFWTGIAYTPGSLLGRCVPHLPDRLKRHVINRRLAGVPRKRVRTRPLGELLAIWRLRAGRDEQSIFLNRNAAFQDHIPQGEFAISKAVVGFDTSSWILADRAASLGRVFILDQSHPHPLSFQKLVPRLQEECPDWAEDFPQRLPGLLRAEQAEHQSACKIVVASSFTKRTLIENGVSADKIVLNPYGVDLVAFVPVARPDSARPLRFLFLGALGARKGVPVLLDAWRSTARSDAELWLAGPTSARHLRMIPTLPGLRLVGKVPRVAPIMAQCDVLVLPSYFEGFGLVLLEALASGMPIITTDATAAPDLITDGVEGHIVPVGDAEAVRAAMQRFIDAPNELAKMSRSARECAERHTWDAYGDRWANLLQQVA